MFCKVPPTDSYFFMIELLKLMLYMVLCPIYTLPGFRVYWAFFWFNALFAHVWRIRVMCMLGLRCLSFLCVMEICWQFLLSEIHRRSALFERFVYVFLYLGFISVSYLRIFTRGYWANINVIRLANRKVSKMF